jgi:nitrite reductase/ring-hydroxylating ferredoxin subunit
MSQLAASAPSPSPWVRAASLDALRAEGRAAVRVGGRDIALFLVEGRVYACQNACPHEGHPLVQGEVAARESDRGEKGCVLTCVLHNWKFSLPEGRCVMGGEDVRAYPARVEGDGVFLDLGEPDPGEILRKNLRKALRKNKGGRMAHAAVQLLELGARPLDVVREAARHGCVYGDEGWSVELCAAVDCAHALALYGDEEKIFPLMQALSLAAEPNVRREPREAPEPADLSRYASKEEIFKNFRRLVEEDEAEAAEALFRAAASGASALEGDELERALVVAASDHFLDDGDSLLYVLKASELLDTLGRREAGWILPPLVPAIVLATRKDKLPPMKATSEFLGKISPGEWKRLLERRGEAAKEGFDEAALRKTLLGGDPAASNEALLHALRGGVSVERIASSMALAAAERMLSFDLSIELDPAQGKEWDDVTQALVVANAIRELWLRHPEPELARALFYEAHLIGALGSLAAPDGEGPARAAGGETEETLVRGIEDACLHRFPEKAVLLVRRHFSENRGVEALDKFFVRHALDDPATKASVVANIIETTRAAIRQAHALGNNPDRCLLYEALARFMASPRRERGAVRSAWKGLRSAAKVFPS